MKKHGFTLAEVLITLAIIGVVAALTIPSVVANTQQQEFKTGLKKAVSVLNSAITMNMAIDGETPYENRNLYKYLGRHMSVMQTMVVSPTPKGNGFGNVSFYTTDGMRFEFVGRANSDSLKDLPLYENPNVKLRLTFNQWVGNGTRNVSFASDCSAGQECAMCGSYGLINNPDNTVNPPCLVVVDVNGDRKPFPQDPECFHKNGAPTEACVAKNVRKFGDPSGKKLTDTFSIMITDKSAIPYGMAAQKAMYEAQK